MTRIISGRLRGHSLRVPPTGTRPTSDRVREALFSAIDARVGQLYLYHLDPSYPDTQVDALHREAQEIIRRRGSALRCEVAREGLVIPL